MGALHRDEVWCQQLRFENDKEFVALGVDCKAGSRSIPNPAKLSHNLVNFLGKSVLFKCNIVMFIVYDFLTWNDMQGVHYSLPVC